MTKVELNAFRKALKNKQAELGMGNREALAVEATSDEMDRIQQFTEREYAIDYLERNSTRLREVLAALDRMDEGMFGVCIECDKNISSKRLAAVPWASTCIPCQEALERPRDYSRAEFDITRVEAA